jgi:hypothetical protein
MKDNLSFNNWLELQEYADYGFSDLSMRISNNSGSKISPKPTNVMFRVDDFLDRLTEILSRENKKIIRKWAEEIFWSDNNHLMETNVNPFGSLRITTRKYIKDLNGNVTPVCKDVFDIDEEHNGREDDVAEVLYSRIKKIREQNYDFAVKEYKDLERLATSLYKACLGKYPSYIMFPKGLKKIDENYYKIFFEFKGSGAGVPGNSRAEQFDIDLAFDKEKGLIKCWGYDIDSPMKQREFLPQPSEWFEYFSPKEDRSNIIKCIIKTLMTY